MSNPPDGSSGADKPSTEVWTVLGLLRWTTGYFERKGVEAPRAGAELLLAHSLGVKRLDLYLRYDQPLSAAELAAFKGLIQRRAQGEPVAYIIGARAFWTLDLAVGPQVLIPRPETERLVEIALAALAALGRPRPRVMDLGTGSGAIVLALAAEHPEGIYLALDRSPQALQTARMNQARNTIAADIAFLAADWCAPLSDAFAAFDLIVSNPPYIAAGEIDGLQAEIRRYEPRTALDGGPDGLACLRLILDQAAERLVPGGHLILEIGADQGQHLTEMAARRDAYVGVEIIKDYAGLDRVAHLRRKRSESG